MSKQDDTAPRWQVVGDPEAVDRIITLTVRDTYVGSACASPVSGLWHVATSCVIGLPIVRVKSEDEARTYLSAIAELVDAREAVAA